MRKVYWTIGIISLLSAILLVFAVYPLFQEVAQTSQDFLSEREKMVLLQEQESSLEQARRAFESFRLDLASMESYLFNPEVPIIFISFLEETSEEIPVDLKIDSMTRESAGDFWPGLSFRVLITGSLPEILMFLEKLENSPYFIKTLSLNVRRLTEREIEISEGRDVLASLSFLVYTR